MNLKCICYRGESQASKAIPYMYEIPEEAKLKGQRTDKLLPVVEAGRWHDKRTVRGNLGD